jgi:plastocyanin
MYKAILLVVTAVLIIGGFLTFNNSPAPVNEVQPVPTTDKITPESVTSEIAPAVTAPSETGAPVKVPVTTITPAPTPAPSATASVKEFTVTGSNFAFAPNAIKVKKGDKVRIIFKNADGFHDLKIDEFSVATSKIQGGAQEIVEFTADKAGAFEYYCSVGSHRQMGMKGTLVVE